MDHAFGGALALAYYAEPRGTVDVDVNVFVPFDEANDVVNGFATLGFTPEQPPDQWSPAAGVRLLPAQGTTPLDLFFSLDASYDEIARRKLWFPFGADRRPLPFLSAEDVVIFKLSFGRDKDWVDLRRLVAGVPTIDLAYIERQVLGLRGSTMHPRLARLRAITRQAGEKRR